ncbi:ty3-gypsy retrotransposon protein, partial [Tanacetum coccineum]
PLSGIKDMVQTRASTNEGGSNPPDSVAIQLAAIAAKLNDDGGSSGQPQQHFRPYNKIDFPSFSRGDPRGWFLKAEKYFKYYHIPDEEKVEVASMHLEGDALDLYAWLSIDESFARRSSRVSNWPDHCLLGVFLNGLKEELKSYVRILKPRTVYNAMSLTIEFESKVSQSRPGKSSTWTPNSRITVPESKNTTTTSPQPTISPKQPPRITDAEKQNRFLKGECFRCGDKYGPGHRCKTGTFKLLEVDDVTEEPPDTQEVNLDENPSEVAEISLHAIFGKSQPTTMNVHGTLNSTEGSFNTIGGLKVVQDFYPFSIGGVDLVLGIQWLATLNTVQANWKEMFMIFNIDGKQYKLQDSLKPIITKYNTVFDEPRNLPPLRSRTHSFPLVPNSTPPNIRLYRYPFYQKTEIEQQVEELLASGFIQPSTSPFSIPVLLVKKKDNTWRMCVDYRALNNIMIADKYPIPNIDELLNELYGATIFSKLDLRSGYYQIRVQAQDIAKTAFQTHSGHYEFKKVVFLGHVITSEGVQVEQEKISAVQSWPIPTTVKEVRGFLGLTGYYRRFVKNYGLIARPLTTLTKKDGFLWSDEALKAFNELKQALLSTPILRLPNFLKTFVVECDTSSDGVGAILSQDDHPVAYFSKGLSPSNRFKSAYDRELLALVLAQRITLIEQQRLFLKLMPYKFSIIHRTGKENRGADALSRRPYIGTLLTLTVLYCVEVAEIKSGLQTDPYTNDIIQKLLLPDSSSVSDFSFVDQFLFYKLRLVIPNISNLKQEVRLFVQQCLICQQQKYQTLSPAGLLQPLPVPTRIWEDISMDFIVGLPPSGRDVVFLSHFWQELFRLTQTKLQLSTSYHPQTDGQTEVINRGLEAYLRCFAHEQPVKWSSEPPSLLPYVMGETKNAELEQQLVDRDDMLKLIRHNLHKAQDRMRQQANSKRHDISFEVVGPVAYKLELPPESRIHPIFYVSMLKPAHGPISADIAPLPIIKDWEIDIQPHSVFAHRWVYEAGKQVLELLISWCDRPQEEATWETYDLLVDQFPNFRLEDKAFYRERSNDTKKNQVNETVLTRFNSIFGYWLDPLGQSCSWKMEWWWGAVYKPISKRQLISNY